MPDDHPTIDTNEQPILEMRSVTLKDDHLENRLCGMDLSLKPGNLVVVERPFSLAKLPLTAGVAGMLKPGEGTICFQSNDWQKLAFRNKLKLRSKIGQIFESGGWIQNLTLIDNILLGPRHHTDVSEKKLKRRLQDLADAFQLKLVNQRPAFLQPWQRRMFQWIRALMVKPALIVAEHPFDGVPDNYREAVLKNEADFRRSGGATLWITDSSEVIEHAMKVKARIFRVANERLVLCDRGIS